MAAIIVNLECLTNMHVGNGDVNYNIIDNEVERDVTTGYPTINSSGVKGALREYFVNKGVDSNTINSIFGKEGAGKLHFLNADMIAIPLRASAGNAPYYLTATMECIENYQKKCCLFLGKKENTKISKITEVRKAEGNTLEETISVLGKEIHILPEKVFRKLSLPVIARNKLDNGKSVNLWYEEVVPHKSLFSFVVIAEDTDKELLSTFVEKVDNQIIQFGGSASIGYGLCKVTVMGV